MTDGQALLGHPKSSMTDRRYSRWIKGRQEFGNRSYEVKASLGSAQEQKQERKPVLVIRKRNDRKNSRAQSGTVLLSAS